MGSTMSNNEVIKPITLTQAEEKNLEQINSNFSSSFTEEAMDFLRGNRGLDRSIAGHLNEVYRNKKFRKNTSFSYVLVNTLKKLHSTSRV